MGNSSSSLNSLTREDVSAAVFSQGKSFAKYADLVRDNGISGDILVDLTAEEFEETLDELEVKSKLHRRVLTKLFNKARDEQQRAKQGDLGSKQGANDEAASKQTADDVLLGTLPVVDDDDGSTISLPAVAAAEVEAYTSRMPGPEQAEFSSAKLADFRKRKASEAELGHVDGDFFDLYDTLKLAHPPIAKNDLERCAAVDTMALYNIEASDPSLPKLRKILEALRKDFDFAYGRIQMMSHTRVYFICETLAEGLPSEQEEFLINAGESLSFDNEGRRLAGVMPRKFSLMCNYAVHFGRVYIVPDSDKDQAFDAFYKATPIRAYASAPIFDQNGLMVAALTLLDFKPRFDLTKESEVRMLQFSFLVEQIVENWSLRNNLKKLEDEQLSLSKRLLKSKTSPPEGDATIIFTDVQGSTALWEWNPQMMEAALKVHDKIMRQCIVKANGYEITTEGDAFVLAFHDPIDALNFALKAQMELYTAPWPEKVYDHPDAADDPNASVRGLRVRMGVHHGPVTTLVHEATCRIRYLGETVKIAKSTEGMCHGGQILVTEDVWRAASGLRDAFGVSPQVLDLGVHVLLTGDKVQDGVVAKRILQLVPGPLAFDYYGHLSQETFRRRSSGLIPDEKIESSAPAALLGASLNGRKFPPPISLGVMAKSFHDAPSLDGKATFVFVYPVGLKELGGESEIRVAAVLGKTVRFALADLDGYECKEENSLFMATFHSTLPAIQFGLSVLDRLGELPASSEVDWKKLVKVGVHTGFFSCCGPHAVTGRADYFGQVVNRAARVAGAARAGEVWVGEVANKNTSETGPPVSVIGEDEDMTGLISAKLEEVKMLKGVTEEIALYSCSWAF